MKRGDTPSRRKPKDRTWSAKRRTYYGAATYLKSGDIEVVMIARTMKLLKKACEYPPAPMSFNEKICGRATVKVHKT